MAERKSIEITPEMIDAGVKELFWFDGEGTYVSMEEVVKRIFHAMLLSHESACEPRSECQQVQQSSEKSV